MRQQCPAAQPDWPGAAAFGMVVQNASAAWVHYLPVPIRVPPEEAVRINADCQRAGCACWGPDGACSLAVNVINTFAPVTQQLPRCSIRLVCKWWDQEGDAVCHRCLGLGCE